MEYPGGLVGFGTNRGVDSSARQDSQGDVGAPNPDNPDPKQSNDKKCPKKANPIIVATGNKIESETDFVTAGEAALQLRRTWNQHAGGVGIFGQKWISNFDFKLSFGNDYWASSCYARPSIPQCTSTGAYTDVVAHKPDGRQVLYKKNASDGIYYENKPIPISKIIRQPDGTWTLYGEDNSVERYTVGGYPISIKNDHGIGWTFLHGGMNGTQLQRVTHASGRYVQFLWTGDELTEVRDPAQHSYRYTYSHQKVIDGLHLLATTTLPDVPATVIKYHYSAEPGEVNYGAYALTGKSFNDVRYSTFTYDANMRATSSEHAGGVERYTFSYAEDPDGSLVVTETNPLGKQTVYYFNPKGNPTEIIGQASAHCLGAGRGSTYDANGYLDVATDFEGNISDYNYDARGMLQQKIEAQNTPEERTTIYDWDAAKNRLDGIMVVDDSEATFAFEADNRLKTETVKNLSDNGVAGQSHTTTYAYTKHPGSGMLATTTIDGPLPGTGDAVVYSYDVLGNLTSVQNSLGHATLYTNHDALGQIGRVTGANGDIIEYQYDARNRIKAEKRWVNGAWQTTTYTYDGFGRLNSVQRPDGQLRTLEYDAAWRLAREYEPEAGGTYAQKRYTYNNASQVTRIDTERLSTPVTAPTLSAPGTSSTGSYTVSWTTVSGATSYQLDESLNGGAWTQIHNAAAISKAVSGRDNGTYSYRVKACDAQGCGPLSATKSVVVTLTTAPAPPTLTLPNPNNQTGSFLVSWGAVTSASSYRVEESTNGGAWTQIYNGADTGLPRTKPDGTYSYRVRSCNSVGCSSYSASRTVEVDTEDDCPSCLAFSPPDGEQAGSTESHGGDA